MAKAPMVKFNNGQEFPIFGLGTWKVSNLIINIIKIIIIILLKYFKVCSMSAIKYRQEIIFMRFLLI